MYMQHKIAACAEETVRQRLEQPVAAALQAQVFGIRPPSSVTCTRQETEQDAAARLAQLQPTAPAGHAHQQQQQQVEASPPPSALTSAVSCQLPSAVGPSAAHLVEVNIVQQQQQEQQQEVQELMVQQKQQQVHKDMIQQQQQAVRLRPSLEHHQEAEPSRHQGQAAACTESGGTQDDPP